MNDQAPEQRRLERFSELAFKFNEEMPTDVMLKGDGSLWVVRHGNDSRPRKISQQEVLVLLYTAIQRGGQLISI